MTGSHDNRHRDSVFQTLSAEILREERDFTSLDLSEQRALNHPDVRSDPQLSGMVRAFVAERRRALEAALRDAAAPTAEAPARPGAPHAAAHLGIPAAPTGIQVRGDAQRLLLAFEEESNLCDERAAHRVANQLREMARKYPVHFPPGMLSTLDRKLAQLHERLTKFRAQIDELAGRGCAAAAAGEAELVAWVLRRLQAIHAMRPALLTDEHFAELRARLEAAVANHEHSEAIREIVARERAIAAEIKDIAAKIHKFHRLFRGAPHDEAYAAAEAEYRAAVRAVRAHDTEWLASVLIELEGLVEEVHDSEQADKAQHQVDQFLHNVRDALVKLRKEIVQIHEERQRGTQP